MGTSDFKQVCIVTVGRADYFLLAPLMRAVAADPRLRLQIAVAGAHLSSEFGMSWRCIAADGFSIDAKVDMLLASDTPLAIAKSIGLGTIGFADAFDRLAPSVVVLLGDRYETLAAATAAMSLRIPIAHIHGGESSEGAIDEAIRHAISKMSALHFPAAAIFRDRLLQLGEPPERIHLVGSLGVSALRALSLLGRTELEASLGLALRPPCFVVTFHPVTLEAETAEHQMTEMLHALESWPDATVVLTLPNADAEGRGLVDMIDAFVERAPDRRRGFSVLGHLRYLSLLRQADVVVGNSSSGIIEAPAVGTPTVDIGDRQKGRPAPRSVIRAAATATEVRAALARALDPSFRASLDGMPLVYDGDVKVPSRITEVIAATTFDQGLLKKPFHNLPRHPI